MRPPSLHCAALLILGVVAPLLIAATATAQPGGTIHLYADPAFTDATAEDVAPGTLTVYIVWRGGPTGAVAWWFKLAESPGFTGVWTGDTPHTGDVFGDTRTGIHLVEVNCLSSPAHLATVTYQMFGTSAACATISVVGANAIGVRINSCGGEGMIASGGELVVNANGCSVPARAETWGGVKALYR